MPLQAAKSYASRWSLPPLIVLSRVGATLWLCLTQAASNVTVMLLLPPLLQPCTVLLAAGSDTAMFVNSMASSSAPSPNAILASLVEQQAQGVQFDLGGLRVLASSVSHFSFAFNYKINFTIAGSASADIAVSAPHGSWVLPGASVFVPALMEQNASVVVPSFALSGFFGVIDAESVVVDAPATHELHFYNGSVTLVPQVPATRGATAPPSSPRSFQARLLISHFCWRRWASSWRASGRSTSTRATLDRQVASHSPVNFSIGDALAAPSHAIEAMFHSLALARRLMPGGTTARASIK